MAHDVFISYSTKDKLAADTVCARLEAHDIRCWIAPRDVLPGQIWGESIVNAIRGARAMVLILSANANTSDNIPKEVELACSKGVIVIPFRIEDVSPAKSLDYFLSNVHWLDALTTPLDQHIEQLASVIQKILGQPQSPRPAPVPVPPPKPVPSPAAVVLKQPISTGKVIAIAAAAVAIVLIIVFAVFLGSRQDHSSVALKPEPGSQPVSAPDPAGPPVAAPRQDSIIGCWQWTLPLPAPVVIRRDGTITAGGAVTGRWTNVDSRGRKYRFTWPDQVVDDIFITPDGSRMSGKNQYGYPTSAVRLTNAGGFAGTWRWFNNVVVTVRPDGTLTAGTMNARWNAKNIYANEFAITWPAPVDSVTLSGSGTSLSGSNQFGVPVAASKGSGCGN